MFRVPSLVVNFLPGCAWTFEVAQVKEILDDNSDTSTWIAGIDWTFSAQLFPMNKLPVFGPRFDIEIVSRRNLALTFEPSTGEINSTDKVERQESMDQGSPVVSTASSALNENLVLSRVVYSGIPEPIFLSGLPGYHVAYVRPV